MSTVSWISNPSNTTWEHTYQNWYVEQIEGPVNSRYSSDEAGAFWQWNSVKNTNSWYYGSGFKVETPLVNQGTYSIGLEFKIQDTDGYWKKVIDFSDPDSWDYGFVDPMQGRWKGPITESEAGVYFRDGHIVLRGSTGEVLGDYDTQRARDQSIKLAITRNAEGAFTGYVSDKAGEMVRAWYYEDTCKLFETYDQKPEKSRINFFCDDIKSPNEYSTDTKLYTLTVDDTSLQQTEIRSLFRDTWKPVSLGYATILGGGKTVYLGPPEKVSRSHSRQGALPT